MFVALIYKHAGPAEIDRIVGGFANTEEAAEWCSHNLATQSFDIREVLALRGARHARGCGTGRLLYGWVPALVGRRGPSGRRDVDSIWRKHGY